MKQKKGIRVRSTILEVDVVRPRGSEQQRKIHKHEVLKEPQIALKDALRQHGKVGNIRLCPLCFSSTPGVYCRRTYAFKPSQKLSCQRFCRKRGGSYLTQREKTPPLTMGKKNMLISPSTEKLLSLVRRCFQQSSQESVQTYSAKLGSSFSSSSSIYPSHAKQRQGCKKRQ